MISIKQNPNFTKWFQVYSFGKLVDEFEKRAKAIRYATQLAKSHEQKIINIEGLAHEVTK